MTVSGTVADAAIDEILKELWSAQGLFPRFNSAHGQLWSLLHTDQRATAAPTGRREAGAP
jgi:hypothetical protein